jgi:hypothetical protein
VSFTLTTLFDAAERGNGCIEGRHFVSVPHVHGKGRQRPPAMQRCRLPLLHDGGDTALNFSLVHGNACQKWVAYSYVTIRARHLISAGHTFNDDKGQVRAT